jgi:Protein of unknown function (DUF3105)
LVGPADDGGVIRRRFSSSRALGRAPLPVVCVLGLLLSAGPVGVALSDHTTRSAVSQAASLGDVVRRAGCRLSEFDGDPHSNPPVSGRVDERVIAHDGSYVGRTAPAPLAAMHALLHGRVVLQYRPQLPASQIHRLDRLVRGDPTGALLFENQTDMPQPVAATAYLALMTCPRVDATTIGAVSAFRARRGNFGQDF